MRRRSKTLIVSAITAFALVACSADPDPTPESTTSTNPTTTTPVVTTPPPPAACQQPGSFVEGGEVLDLVHGDSDASTISQISWTVTATGCELFVFTFQSDGGSPATTPPSVRVFFLDQLPILRIQLSSTASVIADQRVESDLVGQLFTVTRTGGEIFVDLHLLAPTQARATIQDSPATVRIELLPGIIDFVGVPNLAEDLVVVAPLEGESVSSPIEVRGYARNFPDGVLAIATSGTQIVNQEILPATPSTMVWGEFGASLLIPEGPVLLYLGRGQPGDSGAARVIIPITVE